MAAVEVKTQPKSEPVESDAQPNPDRIAALHQILANRRDADKNRISAIQTRLRSKRNDLLGAAADPEMSAMRGEVTDAAAEYRGRVAEDFDAS